MGLLLLNLTKYAIILVFGLTRTAISYRQSVFVIVSLLVCTEQHSSTTFHSVAGTENLFSFFFFVTGSVTAFGIVE